MSPPLQVESASGRKLMPSSKRSWPPVVLLNPPVTVAMWLPASVPDVAVSVVMARLRVR